MQPRPFEQAGYGVVTRPFEEDGYGVVPGPECCK